MIYHWCPAGDYTAGEVYYPPAFADEGFVHCSYRRQVTATAAELAGGRDDLILLSIEPDGLPVVVEGGFPHVYGPIPPEAVVAVHPFPRGADGAYLLPRVDGGGAERGDAEGKAREV